MNILYHVFSGFPYYMFVNAGRCTSRDTMPEMYSIQYIFRLILALGDSPAPNIVLNNQGFLD
jgi:hypothetical protein